MMTLRKGILIFGFALVSGFALVAAIQPSSITPTRDLLAVEADQVRSVDVRIEPGEQDVIQLIEQHTENRDAIVDLIDIIRSAQLTTEHKCASRGVITLQQTALPSTELNFLPGHNMEWYEFRYGKKIYRVPRREFLAVMRQIGVDLPTEIR